MADLKKRAPFQKGAKQEPSAKKESKETWWVQIRLFPIWLRILIVAALLVLAIILGVMIGYGVIGDGSPADALKWETWQHIIDIMSGNK
ncbi:DNA-directed RNA polymerase subunit beta [Planococcus salinus]|uniref:DNA-directed RNA polymerase subunit beta n=1 Tax=Planococcus salinus TaxID=1848460 RepID=A0A3M8P8I9_9BACL|nr:DNA-directed RNA polymerase subunit beta [Planococcus salinus]RNF40005.1 DNA-directed RNA polymerase subunit beta [Planococcus salinus]